MNIKYLIKHLSGTLVFYSILFISAGHLVYWPGLCYAAIGMIMIGLNYTVLRPDRELQNERSKPGEGAKSWDKVILGLSFLVTILMFIVAGLDSGRFHWTPDLHWSLYVAGAVLTGSGQLLFLIAQKQNRFFSSTVRIQADRGHVVCDTGLYRIVRHPAYAGSLIQALGFPLLFGSWWSILPVTALLILLVLRIILEDKTLQRELTGFRQYSETVRFKAIPRVW